MVVVLDWRPCLSPIDIGNCVIRAPGIYSGAGEYSIDTSLAVHGLVGLVLLFDLYVIFQQVQLFRVRKQSANERNFSD